MIANRRIMDTAPSQAAISIDQLSKTYAGGKRALDNVSLDIPRGSIFGLLGPNGAGKSTLINVLAGIVNKTSGTARVWGFDIHEDPRNAKSSIGIVPQDNLIGQALVTIFSTDGSAEWLKPWTWVSAARGERIGQGF